MINAQEYLNKNYPNKEEITEININNQNLEGQLIIQNFPNLKKIECRNNEKLTSIELNNLPSLDYFHGNGCHLTEITINNCPNITFFNAANNYLSDTNFLNGLNPEKLTILSLHSNNFAEQDLSFLSKFINLEQIFLDNCDEEKFEKGIYNKFSGSLKPLQNLKNLELLSIGNTNISEGLEYLPEKFRKIGLTTSWQVDSGCAKIRQELEKIGQIKEVGEKLKLERERNSKGEEDPPWFNDYYRIAPWREAQKLGKRTDGQKAQEWLDKNYPLEATEAIKKRENIIFLNINGKNLEGDLKLERFTNLKKLDCSFNQLTNLDLSDCQHLTHLNCSWNNLINTDFLKQIPHKEKLEVLRINSNEKIKENLEFLTPFIGLVTLNLEDCPFFGSLEPLKNASKLEKIFISNTHINEGLSSLPESCQKLYCDTSEQKYKSIKIANELSKFSKDRYYDISKWKKDKENSVTSNVLPLERLYVIRSNIKKFVNKWGAEEEDSQTELSKLQNPNEINAYWYVGEGAQWTSRATAVTGGVLAATVNPVLGGVLAAASPVVEVFASQMKERLYDAKEKKWEDFIKDSENLLDNYHELKGMLEKIKASEVGEVNRALNNLRYKANKFLEQYDEDENGTVDLSELIDKREDFAEDLSKENNQLSNIVQAILELEEEMINYRQGSAAEKREEKEWLDSKVEGLFKKLTENQVAINNQELVGKVKEKLVKKEIIQSVFLLGQPDKKQVLVVSQTKNPFNLWRLKGRCTICDLFLKNYSLDLVKYNFADKELKITMENKDFPKWFNSEKEAMEEAIKIELKEQKKLIEIMVKNMKREGKKGIEEGISKREELIIATKRKLLKARENELRSEGQESLVKLYEEEIKKLEKEQLKNRESQVEEARLEAKVEVPSK